MVVYDKDLKENDIIIMCSDGIIESNVEYKNKELWLKELLENITTNDVQKIADINNLQIEQDENLCEMYFGIYDGWKWEDVNNVNPTIKQNQIKVNEIMGIPDQETTKQVEERMTNAITRIARENKGKTILICSHGVAIESFIRGITKQPFNINIEKNSQKNTSVNIINYDFEKNEYEIELLNDISHLMLELER